MHAIKGSSIYASCTAKIIDALTLQIIIIIIIIIILIITITIIIKVSNWEEAAILGLHANEDSEVVVGNI